MQISIAAINDPPSSPRARIRLCSRTRARGRVAGWATAISAGAPRTKRAGAQLHRQQRRTPRCSPAGPAISPDGTLSYTPAPNANGSATVTVRLHDNGGTAAAASTRAIAQTFGIVVTAVNDAPSFMKGADQTVLEDAGAQTVAGWATAISAGPANESGQVAHLRRSPAIPIRRCSPAVRRSTPNGTLTYTPAANASGSATITLRAAPTAVASPTAASMQSPAQTFVITVAARQRRAELHQGRGPDRHRRCRPAERGRLGDRR